MRHPVIRTRLMKLFYRMLYNEFAWAYDLVAWVVSFGQWRSWTRTAIPWIDAHNRPVLELASGPGHLLVSMSRHGLQPIGIDLSAAMCRLAARTTRRANAPVPIVRARAQALPFRSNSFDCSVVTFPTEFILDPLTLGEVARVVCPSPENVPNNIWQMVIVGWVRFGRDTIPSRLLDWLYRVTGQEEPDADIGSDVFRQAGFEPQTVASQVGQNDVVLVLAHTSTGHLPI